MSRDLGAVDAHARTWALIPWLVNGRADDAQRAAAELHLASCPDCRAELAAQQRLRQALVDDGPAGAPDAEQGLQRLLGRLDQLPADQTPVAVAPPPVQEPRRRSGRLNTALAAAVVAQAIGLALLSLQLLRSDEAPYRTLGTPATPTATLAAAAGYRVLPDPALPMQQWQALLDATQLRVADGPNSAGAYVLVPRDARPPTPAPNVLAQLRGTPGVRLAEALGSAP